ncbi:heme peroxidase [Neurospora crassa]|nr:heme peroxidase [Neurospora crassa]
MRYAHPTLAGLLSLAARTGADPTWPAATDEMEEIVYQLQGFKGRVFNDVITPCNNEAAGPGRVTASEWLRVGFQYVDMATHNRVFGTGGLDASLQFELTNGENTGPGHNTTLRFLANYYSSQSSMADLIAAGVYASVRSCGGPVVPLRLGRKDATSSGSTGVPQPQNSAETFRQQFDRMGFSTEEMIQVTACGHTLGGVHSEEFPEIVPSGTGTNGQKPLDATDATFDNKVVTEYISGTTQNPLVVGPAVAVNRHSDFKVFNIDGNATMNGLTSATTFRDVCKTVLQKMIDTVPSGVTLTDPIAPYAVKPVDMQLTLNSGGSSFLLSGYIRVRTTNRASGAIKNIKMTWKDRNGGCASRSCSYTATVQGAGTGFDDTFEFFPISTNIPTSSGISSFTVTVNLNDGTSESYDNNGNSYPLSDAIILQKPQSCLLQSSGALTVSALVRNDITATPSLGISYLTPRGVVRNGNPVPILSSTTVAMTKGDCAGPYTFYSASYTIAGGLSYAAKLSVTAGSNSDSFNKASDLSGSCAAFSGTASCTTPGGGGGNEPDASSTIASSSAAGPSSTSSVVEVTSSSHVTSSTTSSSAPTATGPARKPTVAGYTRLRCATEGSGVRALTGASFAYDTMTLESCAANCTAAGNFAYFGVEYARECYCGNSLAASSSEAPDSECNMLCAGDATEYCGAGNRLELYAKHDAGTGTTATSTTASAAQPTATLGRKDTVGDYVFVGCQTEATEGGRALEGKTWADDGMTLEGCAEACSGWEYFGVEYGRECYCGNTLRGGSAPAPLADCSFTCAGTPYEYCGAGNRLELYRLASASSSSSSKTRRSRLERGRRL